MPDSQPSETKKVLYLVDGSFFAYRYFHSIGRLTSLDGTPVNALYGFCMMLYNLLLEQKNNQEQRSFAVVFDKCRGGFRKQLFSSYKENRSPTPDDLSLQMPLIREAVQAFNLPIAEDRQFEADDLIASYASQAANDGYQVKILSTDKDMMQLVTPDVSVYDPVKKTTYNKEQVVTKYGVAPEQMIEYQMLVGDASDNIPGVRGLGPIRAAALLKKYKTIDQIMANVGELPKVLSRNLIAAQPQFPLIRDLVTLRQDLNLTIPLTKLREQPTDLQNAIRFCQRYQFTTILQRLTGQNKQLLAQQPPQPVQNSQQINNQQQLQLCVEAVRASKKLGLYLDNSLVNHSCLCLSPTATEVRTVNLNQLREKDLSILQQLLSSTKIQRVSYDVKTLMHYLDQHRLQLGSSEDLMIMEAILTAGKAYKRDLDSFLSRYDHLNDEDPTKFSCQFLHLFDELLKKLERDNLLSVYRDVDQPMITVLFAMEKAGILIDVARLDDLSEIFKRKSTELAEKVYALAGKTFNLASPQQVAKTLFEDLKLPAPKSSRSTNSAILQQLARDGHSIASFILKWRTVEKMANTYTKAIPQKINQNTGRVHTTFNLTATSTGRLSSNNPNMQNIPLRSSAGHSIRNAFIAESGCSLVCADYSQIELRILAHFAKVRSLEEAFIKGQDIHTFTASQVFAVPLDKVTATQRQAAKAVNFGIIYGMSSYGLANQLQIKQELAVKYINDYLGRYPEIKEFMRNTRNLCRQQGYVTTLTGRRCYIPEILDSQVFRRQYAERLAINAPIQGGAADLIKLASVKLFHALNEKQLPAKILLQVHDELILEVADQQLTEVCQLTQQVMEQVFKLEVPLVVDVLVGKNWGEAKTKFNSSN